MLELKGKYNTAKVFTDNIDDTTTEQVTRLMDMIYAKDYITRIMPDCHAGSGCVVGTTIKFTDKIVPNLVGSDSSCGMYAVKLEEKEIDLEKLDNVINNSIPSGFNIRKKAITDFDQLDLLFAPVNTKKALKSIGTLGSGNHFIELNKDSEDNFWLVIHTGSRHLGLEVCNFYQDQAIKYTKETANNFKPMIEEYKRLGRQKEIQKALAERGKDYIPDHLCYLEANTNGMFENYLKDMDIAADFAAKNRYTIFTEIMKYMNWKPPVQMFHTVHNYVDTKNKIIRKGAVSAEKDELLIIPMNMRDGSLICRGKGNPDWNYSAPHGAGRILSRGQAKSQLSMEEFESSMKGIYSSSVVQSTIDESPMAYKPMQEIIDNIKDTAEIVDIIKPVYNFKAH